MMRGVVDVDLVEAHRRGRRPGRERRSASARLQYYGWALARGGRSRRARRGQARACQLDGVRVAAPRSMLSSPSGVDVSKEKEERSPRACAPRRGGAVARAAFVLLARALGGGRDATRRGAVVAPCARRLARRFGGGARAREPTTRGGDAVLLLLASGPYARPRRRRWWGRASSRRGRGGGARAQDRRGFDRRRRLQLHRAARVLARRARA